MSTTHKNIFHYKSLILYLSVSELKLRYRNSFLGFMWSFLEPLLMLGVLYLVFTTILGSDIEHYPLYLLLGLIMWNTYTRATSSSLNSLLSKSGIVSRMYLPREIMPIASTITSFMMLGFELGAFAIFLAAFQFVPPVTIVFLPLLFLTLFMLSLGISFLLAVANVYFRDMQYIWNVLIQAGFFLSPIIFKLSVYPENIRNILKINPMTIIIDEAHNVALYNKMPEWTDFLLLLAVSVIVLITGYVIFKKYESRAIELL